MPSEARHPDPFEGVWGQVLLWLQEEPDATAKVLFERLRSQHPDRFKAGRLRTLQRRVREWRAGMARQLVYGGLDDAEPWAISPMGAADTSPEVVSPGVLQNGSSIPGG